MRNPVEQAAKKFFQCYDPPLKNRKVRNRLEWWVTLDGIRLIVTLDMIREILRPEMLRRGLIQDRVPWKVEGF